MTLNVLKSPVKAFLWWCLFSFLQSWLCLWDWESWNSSWWEWQWCVSAFLLCGVDGTHTWIMNLLCWCIYSPVNNPRVCPQTEHHPKLGMLALHQGMSSCLSPVKALSKVATNTQIPTSCTPWVRCPLQFFMSFPVPCLPKDSAVWQRLSWDEEYSANPLKILYFLKKSFKV